ncbi:type II secretion system protein GspC [Celerinatantimonas diazotrophica]|uniref:General secretion pathway protein C n=1 Tax=Celerinatantimonas diazotrophica TaxID=412034 RepID=A0A4R1KDR3_9GAMM|nr:type II secretion system protein GspC [Celerinatantimonas diazotrophica]TCK62755.1 general secretion pathway protein C [Celerinatantimonas diazotrophica]CAG9298385.1 hypothetical protein CEDIAZO_03585 [Celerinatantimonas diazotrophica]
MNQLNQIALWFSKEQVRAKAFAVFSCCLIILGCYQLALLSWKLWPQDSASSLSLNSSIGAHSADIPPFNDLLAIHLFGQASGVSRPGALPNTQLPITLVGVLYSNDPSQALAVIARSGQQHVYGQGERIEGTQATLKRVYPDHVVITRKGHDEQLYLPDSEHSAQMSAPVKSNALPSSEKAVAIPSLADIFQNPAKLNRYISIKPTYQGQKLLGYELFPGPDPKLFNQLGLQSGDLAVSMNGQALNEPRGVIKMFRQLNNATECQVIVIRHGMRRTITIHFPT